MAGSAAPLYSSNPDRWPTTVPNGPEPAVNGICRAQANSGAAQNKLRLPLGLAEVKMQYQSSAAEVKDHAYGGTANREKLVENEENRPEGKHVCSLFALLGAQQGKVQLWRTVTHRPSSLTAAGHR